MNTQKQIQDKAVEELHEKFVEFAPDGSEWGAGLRIKHTGTTEDRDILDNIEYFLTQAISEAFNKGVEEGKK